MTGKEYQDQALDFAPPGAAGIGGLEISVLGLCGESGEVADYLKKVWYHGHFFDRQTLLLELGDILWYVALAAESLHTNLDDIMAKNLVKLRTHYPEGFTSERSQHRDVVAEEAAAEAVA